MSWLTLATLLLKLFGSIADYINDKKLIDAGQQKQLASDAAAIFNRLAGYTAVDKNIAAMSDAAVVAELHARFQRPEIRNGDANNGGNIGPLPGAIGTDHN